MAATLVPIRPGLEPFIDMDNRIVSVIGNVNDLIRRCEALNSRGEHSYHGQGFASAN